jgi:bifunctional DNA-binding transcriptional regulator/antitoxin component of YhaV-PrlF toxin-antitoxin module
MGKDMPKVSSKRQITLPIDLCEEADIAPGDIVETYVYRGQITVVKKEAGAAEGVLRHLRGDSRITDEQSRQRALAE